MLQDHWPLFDLRIRTPRLELRYPSDDDLGVLVELAREPVHDASFMPFTTPWTRAESPMRERNALQFWWRLRAGLSVQDWTLPFMVIDDGDPVGVQDLKGTRFPVTRSVTTGSWLVLLHQGRGVGKEMRAAVLHLAFAGLGAVEAHTSAFEDNTRSLGVTRALGYEPNGSQIDEREGVATRHLRFVMKAPDWEARRRQDIEIDNLDACREFLGVTSPRV